MAGLESEAQGDDAAPDSGLDGTERLTRGACDLLLGAPAVEGQFDGPSLDLGKGPKGGAQPVVLVIKL